MTLETHLARINQNIFYKEFSFSRNQFTPRQETELEFADHVIWLDDLFINFQLKERDLSGHHTPETEVKWFEKKVVGLATSQIRDTLNYLRSYEEINITNEKGHTFNVVSARLNEPINVVSYSAHDLLSQEYRRRKYHLSSIAGFIHLIPIDDWVGICRSLTTPAEIREYLEFRKKISTEHKEKVNRLPEQALMGQFLYGKLDLAPDIDFLKYLELFDQTRAEFDLSHILRIFAERVVKMIEVFPSMAAGVEQHQYYQILKELAKLNRNELREVKFRYELCIEDCKKNNFALPYRVTFPRTGCGFVFITVKPEEVASTVSALQGFTSANKYDQKLNKCIGISFSRDGEFYDIGWCYIENAWAHDSEMAQKLKECFPFGSVKEELRPRYKFLGEMPD